MKGFHIAGVVALAASTAAASAAEPVMVQCGREYQAARSAGALNGLDWNGYRAACAERLKAGPAPAVSTPAMTAATTERAPPEAPSTGDPASGGAAAMHLRQKRCGAEWTAQKATLVAATPGLTWPKYWSRCNARIKETGR